jgi:pyruvate/2-oxoacid:ferredoxin oxidoreductase beta subunit
MTEIMAAHRIPYAATAAVAYPDDLREKVRRAKNTKGSRFLHILSPCPPGWRFSPEMTIRLARLAVDSRAFPIYEVRDGTSYRITIEPRGVPLREYLRPQGRFRHLTESEIEAMQKSVDAEWERLVAKVEASR